MTNISPDSEIIADPVAEAVRLLAKRMDITCPTSALLVELEKRVPESTRTGPNWVSVQTLWDRLRRHQAELRRLGVSVERTRAGDRDPSITIRMPDRHSGRR